MLFEWKKTILALRGDCKDYLIIMIDYPPIEMIPFTECGWDRGRDMGSDY